MNDVPVVMLNNGQTIPQLGFGVFLVPPAETAEAVSTALQAGYRHIDTAQGYQNEKEVGEAVAKSGLPRGEVFLTTKLGNADHRPDDARRAFEASLTALGTDYVDLYLIHWPLPTGTTVTSCRPGGRWRSSTVTAGPGRSACRTSSRTTSGGCTRKPRSRPRSTRSRCTRT